MLPIVSDIHQALAAAADPRRAGPMAAYLKTEEPCFGVDAGTRRSIVTAALRRHPITGPRAYQQAIEALWALPEREHRSGAIDLARACATEIRQPRLPLYRRMIISGAWWDLVDDTAAHLVGRLVDDDPATLLPIMDAWIEDANLWVRRSALICQLTRRERCDSRRLFRWCRQLMPESDFFIRKAIGWALRQHARCDPQAVAAFCRRHAEKLSPLSLREASKHLDL
jgi:3-methyladenine DNA glycosylase AlkD